MKRRKFLQAAGGLTAATTFAAPAIAQSQPTVRWRMPSSFPKSLDTVYGGAELVAGRVRKLTDGKFEIRPFAAGEIVPPLQVLDAVQNGTVELGHTAGFYYTGKAPALVFDTGVPFGLTPRQHNAWIYQGGGAELMREIYAGFNVSAIPCGNTGAQMGGWFRKEIKSVDDLKGLRIRTPGFLGQVYAKLGAVPQQIAGGDIYPALERGTIDAVEWVGPYDDEKLGFNKVAKYYYGPGVLELGASLTVLVNNAEWAKLPPPFQEALRSACKEAVVDVIARYDAQNVAALRRLVGAGVELKQWPREVMRAMQQATTEVLEEHAARDAAFKNVYTAWKQFRDDEHLWFAVNDGAAENFVYASRSRG
jgi:TRAP-type mannitol/chloroaromatic compound transport system substrate-binding protein